MKNPLRLVSDERPSALFVITLTAAFIALTAFIAAHHEPWRDEADEWLFVRDASLGTILARTRYTGFPALWYIVLAPLAKIGLPYGSQKVLHLLFAGGAIAVYAARAPLTRLTKVLSTFSYYFAYEYAVIVRNYALTVFLTFVATAMYSRRREHPIAFAAVLFLLFNVNVQGFVIAAAFAALFVLERIRSPAAIAIMASGAVISYIQVRTPPDPSRQGAAVHVFNREAFAWVVGNGFLPNFPTAAGFVIGLLVLLAITLAIARARDALAMLWLPLAVLSIVHSYIWLGGLRHAGFVLVLAIVAIWIAAERTQPSIIAALLLNGTLLFADLQTVRYAISDTKAQFSGSKEMALFIRDHGLEGREIAAHNLTQCEAVLPYLPHTRFWYAGLGEYGTYLKWDAAFERALDVPYPVAEARARKQFSGKDWLLLFNVEMPDPAAHGFRLLYTNREPIFEKTDERYWLYAPLQ